jgi:hypothetical protein
MLTTEQLQIVEAFGSNVELKIFWQVFNYEHSQKRFRSDYNGQPNSSFNKALALKIFNRCLER